MKEKVSTFFSSLTNKQFGNRIVGARTRKVVQYWLTSILLLSLIPILISLSLITYFVPQIPKKLKDHLPDGEISVKQGVLSTSFGEKFTWKSDDFSLLIDLSESGKDVVPPASSLLLTATNISLVTPENQKYSYNIDKVQDITLSKTAIVTWFNQNLVKVWGFIVLILIIGALFSIVSFAAYELTVILVISAIIFVINKLVFKKPVAISGIFKLSTYSSIISLVVSTLFSFLMGPMSWMISMSILFGYTSVWLLNIQSPQKPAQVKKSKK